MSLHWTVNGSADTLIESEELDSFTHLIKVIERSNQDLLHGTQMEIRELTHRVQLLHEVIELYRIHFANRR